MYFDKKKSTVNETEHLQKLHDVEFALEYL